jgi:hypothetical protein
VVYFRPRGCSIIARQSTKAEGQRLTEALLDARLEFFTLQGGPEAAVSEITSRIATKRLKVISICTKWLGQYRTYRRNKDGELIESAEGMIRYMDLLAFSERYFPMPAAENATALDD